MAGRMRPVLLWAMAAVLAGGALPACQRAAPPGSQDPNMLLGNPSRANDSTANSRNFLVPRPQFTLSYNHAAGGPNWVSWHLQSSDIGKARRGKFRPDPLLPLLWQIYPSDYTNSGYERGHLCPSKDRSATRDDNDATFVMSNVLPQTADLNEDVWEGLESYCRERARDGNELFLVSGGYGSRGRIASNQINVPAHCWKLIVELPQGDRDLERINANTRVIAVDMPNEDGIRGTRWQRYLTTPAALERETGYQFFTSLAPDVQSALRNKRDRGRAR
jgi:endonuclease G